MSGGSLTSNGTSVIARDGVFDYSGGEASLGHLYMRYNGRLDVSGSGNTVLKLEKLDIHAFPSDIDAVIDLRGNRMEIVESGEFQWEVLREALRRGYNNGSWTGSGITSSAAAASASSEHPMGLGYRSHIEGGKFFTRVQLALYGDADVDGDVDLDDVGAWAVNFTGELGGTGPTFIFWYQGDWDYDGDVDLDDVGRWSQNFTGELGGGASVLHIDSPLHPQAERILQQLGITVVPEPAASVLALLCLAGPLAYCRRGGAL
jgi:hypothetical protein